MSTSHTGAADGQDTVNRGDSNKSEAKQKAWAVNNKTAGIAWQAP